MTCVYCGNGLSLLSTKCPRCGKKYIRKAALTIVAFVIGVPSVLVGLGFLIIHILTTMEQGGY